MNDIARHIAAAVAASIGVAAAGPCAAADWFLRLEQVQGESTDTKHKGEIDVLSWSWSVDPNPSANGLRASKPCVSDLSFSKAVDKATPQLIGNAASGMRIPRGTLVGRRTGAKVEQEYLRIELRDIVVSSFQTGSVGSAAPLETVSLSFETMVVEYRPQAVDGAPGTAATTTVSGGCGGAKQ